MKKSRDTVGSFNEEQRAFSTSDGESKTDWSRVDAMTEADLEAAIAGDPDEAGMVVQWEHPIRGIPLPKEPVSIRLDADLLAFFRQDGKGYQTKINAVLRSYMDAVTRGKTAP
jgi:uncharacterized protein (DUF4415 family)